MLVDVALVSRYFPQFRLAYYGLRYAGDGATIGVCFM